MTTFTVGPWVATGVAAKPYKNTISAISTPSWAFDQAIIYYSYDGEPFIKGETKSFTSVAAGGTTSQDFTDWSAVWHTRAISTITVEIELRQTAAPTVFQRSAPVPLPFPQQVPTYVPATIKAYQYHLNHIMVELQVVVDPTQMVLPAWVGFHTRPVGQTWAANPTDPVSVAKQVWADCATRAGTSNTYDLKVGVNPWAEGAIEIAIVFMWGTGGDATQQWQHPDPAPQVTHDVVHRPVLVGVQSIGSDPNLRAVSVTLTVTAPSSGFIIERKLGTAGSWIKWQSIGENDVSGVDTLQIGNVFTYTDSVATNTQVVYYRGVSFWNTYNGYNSGWSEEPGGVSLTGPVGLVADQVRATAASMTTHIVDASWVGPEVVALATMATVWYRDETTGSTGVWTKKVDVPMTFEAPTQAYVRSLALSFGAIVVSATVTELGRQPDARDLTVRIDQRNTAYSRFAWHDTSPDLTDPAVVVPAVRASDFEGDGRAVKEALGDGAPGTRLALAPTPGPLLVSQNYVVPYGVMLYLVGSSPSNGWLFERSLDGTTWTQVWEVASPGVTDAPGFLHTLCDAGAYVIQQETEITHLWYRARTKWVPPGNPSGLSELSAWSNTYRVELPAMVLRERVWPHHNWKVEHVLRDVSNAMGDRLNVIISLEELKTEFANVMASAWPVYGEVWRYAYTLTEQSVQPLILPEEVQRQWPQRVSITSATGQSAHALRLTKFRYTYRQLVIPTAYFAPGNVVIVEMMLPPQGSEINDWVCVSRDYLVSSILARILPTYGERTQTDVTMRRQEALMTAERELLRTGGGPSYDTQGVSHG